MGVAANGKRSSTRPGRDLAGGTTLVLLAEALLLPTGLATSLFLTRQLGPERYGQFALAVALVTWIEWTISSAFGRATIKSVGDAEDWRPIGTTATRLQLFVGGGFALLIFLAAGPIAAIVDEPRLATLLRIFAIEIPLFSLARAHQYLLVGLGSFAARALATAGHWLSRMVFIILLVSLGLSVPGAILGSIGAILVEFAVARWFVRPSLTGRSVFPARQLWVLAAPLFLYSLSLRLYGRMDVFVLKLLGESTEQAGIYAAAQNVAVAPSLIAVAFSPLLLSTLSRTLRAGERPAAQELSRNALRALIVLLPFVGIAAGAAPQIVLLAFGPRFTAGDPAMAWLLFQTLAIVVVTIAASILTAASRTDWPIAIVAPMLPLSVVGQLLLVPRFELAGAAAATTLVAGLGAAAAVLAVHRVWGVLPPFWTLARAAVICVVAYVVADDWSSAKPSILLKLPAMVAGVGLAFLVLGELSAGERTAVRSAVSARWRRWRGGRRGNRSPR